MIEQLSPPTVYVNPSLPIYPSFLSPLITLRLFSTSVTLFFVNKFICTIFKVLNISNIMQYLSSDLLHSV